jgi:hypothetical protein
MSTSRSDSLYEQWRESTEKLDYFVVGVVGALCAYISQNYKPEQVGINPGTIELLALLILVLGAVFGFRRIEAANHCTSLNHRILYSNETRGALSEVIRGGTGINKETGEIYTPEYAAREIQVHTTMIAMLQPKIDSAKKKAMRSYRLRNAFTLVGFLLILAAKLYSAYV